MNLESTWCAIVDGPNRIVADPATHRLYVSNPRAGEIVLLDTTGSELGTLNTAAHPTAMALDAAGNLFVVDGSVVKQLAPDGTVLMTIGESVPYFHRPHDVAVAGDGSIVVADNSDTIRVFDASGALLRSFGRRGYPAGWLDVPVSLLCRGTELWVADQNNARVNVYTLTGTYLRALGSRGNGSYTLGQFLRPWGMDADGGGDLWVYDGMLSAFQRFDGTDQCVGLFPVDDAQLRTGVDMAIIGDRIFLTDPSAGCIRMYRVQESNGPATLGTPPAAVPALELTLSVEPQGLVLRWNRAGASRFVVLRASTPRFAEGETEMVASTADTFFVDTDALAQWASRFYQVIPLDLAGADGEGPGRRGGTLDTHDSPHSVLEGVECNRCHYTHFPYPNPLPEWWTGDRLCKSCHTETGMAPAQQNHFAGADTVYCNACHDPHEHQAAYPHNFIRTAVLTPHSGWRAVTFGSEADFVHGEPNFDGICEVCHTQTAYHRNNASGDHSHNAGSNCVSCHPHLKGFQPEGGACNSCHDAPPQTAAHQAHVGMPEAGVGYGDLRRTEDFGDSATVYNFGCGNCHPADPSHHQNGTLEIQLYDAAAPATTLKGQNPATASYTPGAVTFTDSRGFLYTEGTCSNVYCHSSGQTAALRTYQTAEWGRTEPYSCGSCHGEPPTYESDSRAGGTPGANSHYQFNLFWGMEDIGHVLGIHWGHNATTVLNQTATVLNCNICHYGTTIDDNNTGHATGQGRCSRCHTDITNPPMSNRGTITNTAHHVSGQPEVQFSPLPFRSRYRNAASGPLHGWIIYPTYAETVVMATQSSYDPATKTCSNVPCHLDQTTVQWGFWSDGENAGCDCHDMGGYRVEEIPEHQPDWDARTCITCHPIHGER